MRRLVSDLCFVTATWLLLILVAVQEPHAQFNSFPPGTFTSRAALDAAPAAGGCTPTCPGDLKPYVVWWATHQCYNSAYTGNVASIWDHATGTTTNTLVTCSSGGVVNETINPLSTTCAVSCELDILYDQSGTLACAGATNCNLSTNGGGHTSRGVIVASGPNSTYCLSVTTTLPDTNWKSANTLTQAQPFSANFVANRTGNTGNITGAIMQFNQGIRIGYKSSVNTTEIYTGATINTGPTASDNALHAIGYVANNASSLIGVDATAASTVALGNTTGFTNVISTGTGSATSFVGIFCEGGIANAAWSSSDIQNVNANAHARYGVW